MYPKTFCFALLCVSFYFFYGTPVSFPTIAGSVVQTTGYAVSLVAWFTLDAIPYAYSLIVAAYVAASTWDKQAFARWCLSLPASWLFYVYGLARSYLTCPRQETFLFFWSYPQSTYCEWYNSHYERYRALSALDCSILLTIAVICSLTALCLYLRYLFDTRSTRVRELWASWLSPFFYGKPYPHPMCLKTYRETFQTTVMPEVKPHEAHSHGQAAAFRASAGAFMRNVATAIAHVPWSYQMSATEQRNGALGSRFPVWVKDLNADLQSDPLPENAAVMMVDVDYYVDIPRWIASNFMPHMFFTFQPQTAGNSLSEFAYSFKDNVVTYEVKGGGRYSHEVWNFQQDAISSTLYLFGVIPVSRASYLVERRAAGCEHEVVLLIPLNSWSWWNTWVSLLFVAENPLKRFNLQAGSHNRLRIHNNSGIRMSTAQVGSTTSITIPVSVDEEILTAARISKTEIAYPTVAQMLGAHRIEDLSGSKTLTEFARSKASGGDVRACVPDLNHYQYTGPRFDPDAKNSLVPFMKPLALPAFAPKVCFENEDKMAKGRVTAVQNDEMPLTLKMNDLINEFIEQFIPDDLAHTFHPVTFDEVLERQARPSQRRIINASEFSHTADNALLEGFMKKEPKPDAGHPRPIVIYEGDTKVRYSQFTYALAEYLKTQDWYAFGKSPLEIAYLIMGKCDRSFTAVTSDGSRWDGRVSNILRELEARILTRFFSVTYQEQALRLHRKQYKRKVRTPAGVQYELEYSRGSGSPETAVFNSIENKFIAFVAHRTHETAEFDSPGPARAYLAPGIYGGDDGVTFNLDARELVAAASSVGQCYASETRGRGESIKFLSRSFSPKVWFGCTDSACDLDRSMRNFNCTTNLPPGVTPIMKLIQKARAYSLTDANTPFIGEFVTAVLEVAGSLADMDDDSALEPMVSWNSRIPKDLQYPNEVDDNDLSWINAPPDFDAQSFRTWIASVVNSYATTEEKLTMFLSPPYCDSRQLPVVAPEAAVVNDQLHPKAPQPPPPSPEAAAPLLVVKPIAPPAAPVPAPKKTFVPCAKCVGLGKRATHSADHCWADKPPAERAKLMEERKAGVKCPKCLAAGKKADHPAEKCWADKLGPPRPRPKKK